MHLYSNLHVIRAKTHPELAQKLKEIICKMKDLFFSGRSDREIRCCMLLMEFMLTLLDYRKELAPELKVEDQYGYSDDVLKRLMSVTDYIKNNLTADDLSQAAMAEMAGISKDYFSRIFKNVTGMNYNKWLNTIRLEKASELLTEEGHTLTEIAMLSGFQSIPSFNFLRKRRSCCFVKIRSMYEHAPYLYYQIFNIPESISICFATAPFFTFWS